MLPYLKPYRDIPSSLTLLGLRGMEFTDPEFAQKRLSRIGYYRLSAYWYPFRRFCAAPSDPGKPEKTQERIRCDRFEDGTEFDQVMAFYLFDKQLRLLISDALERIEIGIRAAIVEVLGALGPHAHRDARSYNSNLTKTNEDGTRPLDGFLRGLDDAFARSKEEFAKHFRKTYRGHPPIWIAAGTWDWGNLAYTLRSLSSRNIQEVCARIDPRLDTRTLISWMAALNEIRNACAHHSRLWNKALTNRPSFQKPGELPEFDHMRRSNGSLNDLHTTRLYGALVAIVFLMQVLHPRTRWHLRLADFVLTSGLPQELSSKSAGFPERWQDQEIWQELVL